MDEVTTAHCIQCNKVTSVEVQGKVPGYIQGYCKVCKGLVLTHIFWVNGQKEKYK